MNAPLWNGMQSAIVLGFGYLCWHVGQFVGQVKGRIGMRQDIEEGKIDVQM